MPLTFTRLPAGNLVLVKTCEACGEPACIGEGVDLRRAIEQRDQKAAGLWWCGPCYAARQKEKAA